MTGAAAIRVSPSGRFFTRHDGSPFFWLGDTQWNLWRCHSHDEAAAILSNRAAKGFSVVPSYTIPDAEHLPVTRLIGSSASARGYNGALPAGMENGLLVVRAD